MWPYTSPTAAVRSPRSTPRRRPSNFPVDHDIAIARASQSPPRCRTPSTHAAPDNAPLNSATSKHQPRSWSRPRRHGTYSPSRRRRRCPTRRGPGRRSAVEHPEHACDASQPPMSWLKAVALLNMPFMSVTPEVSHAPMSSLKDAAAVSPSGQFVRTKQPRHVRHAPVDPRGITRPRGAPRRTPP